MKQIVNCIFFIFSFFIFYFLLGEGKAFCSGYDLMEYAQSKGSKLGGDDENGCWDPMADFYGMYQNTQVYKLFDILIISFILFLF